MADHIFISYARLDGRAEAQRLYEALVGRGYRAWQDHRDIDPHQDFSGEIEAAIESARHVVVCLTPEIARRKDSFVRREIIFAQGCKKPITPVVFPGFPEGHIPVLINHLTWLRFYDPASPSRLDFEAGFEALLTRLAESPAYVPSIAGPDRFQGFLHALHKDIAAYLQETVFSLLTLHSEVVPEAVRSEQHPHRRALPVSFFAHSLPVIQDALETPAAVRSFASFAEAFDHHAGRVLLLGQPGAGKTTTLLAFTREAVARRLEDPREPLPLPAKVADWVADGMPSIVTWIAGQNGLDPAAVERESQAGRVMLLLDGLDEATTGLDEERLFGKISAAISACPEPMRIAVSCRAAEYEAMGERLALKGAVMLTPLDDAQIAEYLVGSPDLQAAVRNDPQLREMARTPLLLSLLAFAYRGVGSKGHELQTFDGSPVELRDRIFQTFVTRRYEFERRKPYAGPSVDLQQLYSALGIAALREVDMSTFIESVGGGLDGAGDWRAHSIHETLLAVLGDGATTLIEQGRRLHLLVRDSQGRVQFIHRLLGNHFASAYALERLQSDDESEAVRAAYVLGRLADPRAASALVGAFSRNSSGLLSVTAGRALGRIRGIPAEAGGLLARLEAVVERDDPEALATRAEVVGTIQEIAVTNQQRGEHWKSIALLERGRELVQPRTDLDRPLALALGGRAERIMQWCDGLRLLRPPDDVLEVVLADLEQAIRVDPTLGDPFWDLGVAHARFRADYLKAERFVQKACDIGYSHPMLPRLKGLLQAKPPLARPAVTDSIRLLEVLLRLAIQVAGPLAAALNDEEARSPDAEMAPATFGDHVVRAQAIAGRNQITDDDYLRIISDSRRAIPGDPGESVADLLRRVADLRGEQPLLDRATANHLEILRDASFAVFSAQKDQPKGPRRAIRLAARGLNVIRESRASIDPNLHADLLLAMGQALYYDRPPNLSAAIRAYHEALRLKRAAGNEQDSERLARLLGTQIDFRMRPPMPAVGPNTRETLEFYREVAEDLGDPGRVERIKRVIEALNGTTL
jgi:tetratricopeptide (TPR) repeat protein